MIHIFDLKIFYFWRKCWSLHRNFATIIRLTNSYSQMNNWLGRRRSWLMNFLRVKPSEGLIEIEINRFVRDYCGLLLKTLQKKLKIKKKIKLDLCDLCQWYYLTGFEPTTIGLGINNYDFKFINNKTSKHFRLNSNLKYAWLEHLWFTFFIFYFLKYLVLEQKLPSTQIRFKLPTPCTSLTLFLPSMRAYSLKIENCRVISEWKSLAGSRCTLEDFGATEGKLKEVNIQPSKSRFRAVIICDSCLPTDNARDFLSSRTPSSAIARMEIRISLSVPRNHVKILSRCRELAFSLRSLKLAQFFCAINFPIKRRWKISCRCSVGSN